MRERGRGKNQGKTYQWRGHGEQRKASRLKEWKAEDSMMGHIALRVQWEGARERGRFIEMEGEPETERVMPREKKVFFKRWGGRRAGLE